MLAAERSHSGGAERCGGDDFNIIPEYEHGPFAGDPILGGMLGNFGGGLFGGGFGDAFSDGIGGSLFSGGGGGIGGGGFGGEGGGGGSSFYSSSTFSSLGGAGGGFSKSTTVRHGPGGVRCLRCSLPLLCKRVHPLPASERAC